MIADLIDFSRPRAEVTLEKVRRQALEPVHRGGRAGASAVPVMAPAVPS